MIDTTNMGIMANFVQPISSVIATNVISKSDENFDSNLSIKEMGISNELFSSYDTNLDDLISKSELTTAIETAMSQSDGKMPSKEDFQSILASFGFESPNNSNSNSLSSAQLDKVSSILENYDPNNLTKNDAQEIVMAFKEADIKPSAELKDAMENAGFDAKEVGTLAGVIPQDGPPPKQGGGQMPEPSSSSNEEYDAMDINEDGVVTFDEMMEYYGNSDDNFDQNALDNLKLLMETIKSNSNSDLSDTNSFNGLLKAINNQNNNSNLNVYLENSTTSSMFDYA